MDKELEDLKRNFEIIVPENGLAEKLKWSRENKKPLRVKLGIDPTAPDLHLGHAVVLRKLREFQEYGHKVVMIIGDFTARIGDPTGRNKTRPPLTEGEIEINAKTYLEQLSKIIDVAKAEIHFNSEWLDKLHLKEIIEILAKVTVSQILERQDFHSRYNNNVPIFFHEMLYPIMQGYDSVMIDADIELGGTEQLFNCLVGRDLQGSFNKRQQIVACLPLLKGTDGVQKMSKSLGNYIGLSEHPNDMFGKVMSIPDSVIEEYARLASSFSSREFKALSESLNPMELKKAIARSIVEQYHGKQAAEESAEHFYRQVQSRDPDLIEFVPVSLQELGVSEEGMTLLNLCALLQADKSKSHLKKVIEGGGVSVNNEKVVDPFLELKMKPSLKVKIGKRNFYELT